MHLQINGRIGMDAKMLSLTKNGESDHFEFKASFGREAIETLSAFANTKGGAVLIGVGDD
ncbi:MAG: helix-turn-helix domain-containing protein [Dissulfuribacterales bacterium]